MTDMSARLALPMLQPGQAQKEMVHNEALALLDLAVQATVVAVGIDVPPVDPQLGQCWVLGSSPVGGWAGHPGAVAGWTAGGWRFVAPREGMAVWDVARGQVVRRVGDGWVGGGAAIAAPLGGVTVDAEARTTIGSILAVLRTHGLIGA